LSFFENPHKKSPEEKILLGEEEIMRQKFIAFAINKIYTV